MQKAAKDGTTLQHIASTSILLIFIMSVAKCEVLQNWAVYAADLLNLNCIKYQNKQWN